MQDDLEARVEALERALTDGEGDFTDIGTAAERADRLADLEKRLDSLADRVCELEAATQAVRGYVGNVRAVNDDVESRADAALAKAEALEAELDACRSSGCSQPEELDTEPETGDPSLKPDADSTQSDGVTGDGGQDIHTGQSVLNGDENGHRNGPTASRSRCEHCGQPHADSRAHKTEHGVAANSDQPDSHRKSGNTADPVSAGIEAEPEISGLRGPGTSTDAGPTTDHANGDQLTNGHDAPGTLERIRQLL